MCATLATHITFSYKHNNQIEWHPYFSLLMPAAELVATASSVISCTYPVLDRSIFNGSSPQPSGNDNFLLSAALHCIKLRNLGATCWHMHNAAHTTCVQLCSIKAVCKLYYVAHAPTNLS